MPLQWNATIVDAIRNYAAGDYPHECCGFLVGTLPAKNTEAMALTTVTRAVPADNTRLDSPQNRFEISPLQMLKADRAARADGLSVVGFYHSHPDAPALPSEYDREHAWPGYCYIIVSVKNRNPVDIRNWRLRDDRSRFDEDPILQKTPHTE